MFTAENLINTLLPNNPVVEKGCICIQGENEGQVSRPLANTLKNTDLATGKQENSRASRPTTLGRGTTVSNGFSSGFPGSPQAGGSQASSLQSSLDFDSSPESEVSAHAHAQLEHETRNLLTVFLQKYNGLKHQRCSQPEALATMDRVVKSLARKHEIAYKGDTLS